MLAALRGELTEPPVLVRPQPTTVKVSPPAVLRVSVGAGMHAGAILKVANQGKGTKRELTNEGSCLEVKGVVPPTILITAMSLNRKPPMLY